MSREVFTVCQLVKKVPFEKPKEKINAIDCAAQYLFVGTSEGNLYHYEIDHDPESNNPKFVESAKSLYRLKRPISQLILCLNWRKLLILCEGTLQIIDIVTAERANDKWLDNFKGICYISRNDCPLEYDPMGVEIVVSYKKKTVQVVHLTENRADILCDIILPDVPINTSFSKNYCVVSTESRYLLINTRTMAMQELFSFTPNAFKPFSQVIDNDKFFVVGPTENIGVLVSFNGNPINQPLVLHQPIIGVVKHGPFFIILSTNCLNIFNELNTELLQSIDVMDCNSIIYNDYLLVVSTTKSLYGVHQKPIINQANDFLDEMNVQSAIQLVQLDYNNNNSESSLKTMNHIVQKSIFVLLNTGLFQDAHEIACSNFINPFEILNLLDDFQFYKKLTVDNDYKYLLDSIKEKISENEYFKNALISLVLQILEKIIKNELYEKSIENLHYCYLELLCLFNKDRLPYYCLNNLCSQYYETSSKILQHYMFDIPRSFVIFKYGSEMEAIEYWTKLEFSDNKDAIDLHMICSTFYNKFQNKEAFWHFLKLIWSKNQKETFKIILKLTKNNNKFIVDDYEAVVEIIQTQQSLLIEYLSYLFKSNTSHNENMANIIPNLYIGMINNNRDHDTEILSKLLDYFEYCHCYNAHLIFKNLKPKMQYLLSLEIGIHCIINLYKMMKMHKQALQLIASDLKSISIAEKYCLDTMKNDDIIEKKLKNDLFTCAAKSFLLLENNSLTDDINKFICQYSDNINPLEIIDFIPKSWPIEFFIHFLFMSLRKVESKKNLLKIKLKLLQFVNVDTSNEYYTLAKKHILICDDSICQHCNKYFNESSSVVTADKMSISHIHCSSK